jgi:lipoprotein-anchoring transpeptidase ErfK/SrfK
LTAGFQIVSKGAAMNRFFRFGLLGLLLLLGGCAEFENTMYDLRGLPPGKVAIVIDLTDQHAYLYAGREVVLTAPVSTGREGYNTSAGKYAVIQKDIGHRSSIYGAYLQNGYIVKRDVDVRKDPKPAGATFVGAPMPYFLRIYGGVGMHAGYLPGYPASHGCIRMPESKARRFFEVAKLGTRVIVKR